MKVITVMEQERRTRAEHMQLFPAREKCKRLSNIEDQLLITGETIAINIDWC